MKPCETEPTTCSGAYKIARNATLLRRNRVRGHCAWIAVGALLLVVLCSCAAPIGTAPNSTAGRDATSVSGGASGNGEDVAVVVSVDERDVSPYGSSVSIGGNVLRDEESPVVFGGVVYLPVDAVNEYANGLVTERGTEMFIGGDKVSGAQFLDVGGRRHVRLSALDFLLDYDERG